MSQFQDFNLTPTLAKALTEMGFNEPTPIQAKAIPIALTGKDVIGCAQTGTGKTAAFCLPLFMRLKEKSSKMALVLVPTRELALQIEVFWRSITKYNREMSCVNIMGGVSMGPQLKALKARPRLVIATPGRLCDHLERGTVNLSQTCALVLDEADRMLDMGFAPQLNEILRFLPPSRQTLLFTATWESKLDSLAKKYLVSTGANSAERVSVGEVSKAATNVTQNLIAINTNDKRDVLLQEIQEKQGTILVFVRTQARTDRIAKFLSGAGLNVDRIHGGRSQSQRTTALTSFRKGKIDILVATDIAARGIDVADIAHVINFDLPQVPEDYIHRIGRTGRAGTSGTATSLLAADDRQLWADIAKLLKKTGSPVPIAKNVKMPEGHRPAPVATEHPKNERKYHRGQRPNQQSEQRAQAPATPQRSPTVAPATQASGARAGFITSSNQKSSDEIISDTPTTHEDRKRIPQPHFKRENDHRRR